MTFDVEVADACLLDVAASTASALQDAAVTQQWSYINERDHLQVHCADAARGLAAQPEAAFSVSTQLKLPIPDWPRLGSVDLALTWLPKEHALLELKCGDGSDTLGPCVWDALKCAFALRAGLASAAYLLAGAPQAKWDAPTKGAEFFSTGSWVTAELRDSYAGWWLHWEKCGDPQPARLPRSFNSVALGTFPLHIGSTLWELRLARVEQVSGELLDWPRVLAVAPDMA